MPSHRKDITLLLAKSLSSHALERGKLRDSVKVCPPLIIGKFRYPEVPELFTAPPKRLANIPAQLAYRNFCLLVRRHPAVAAAAHRLKADLMMLEKIRLEGLYVRKPLKLTLTKLINGQRLRIGHRRHSETSLQPFMSDQIAVFELLEEVINSLLVAWMLCQFRHMPPRNDRNAADIRRHRSAGLSR